MALFQLGVLQFDTFPLSITEFGRESEADFAWHDVVGGLRPGEPVGPGNDEITVRCALHPHRFGGLEEVEVLRAMMAAQEPQILVRGDGRSSGWRVLTKLSERGTYLDLDGVGRCLDVTLTLKRVPSPGRGAILSLLGAVVGTIRSILG